MKKNTVRMMTFHTPKNYGAVLQAYSLMTYMKNMGNDVKVIDFDTPHLRSLYPIYKKPTSLRQMAHWVLDAPYFASKRRKYEKFEKFVAEKLDLTVRYESYAELKNNPPKADIYVTGSDQVFNPNRILDERQAFYLKFGEEKVKRISYAGSFGVDAIPADRKEEIANSLSCFSNLSVREESGIKIVSELLGHEAREVLDPVFLNDKCFWRDLALPYDIGDEPYMLYYRLMNNAMGDQAVRKAAEKNGLRLVVVTDGRIKWKPDLVLRDVGPQELMYLFEHSRYIATDSFHGVAFSLLFEKQFLFSDIDIKLAGRALNLMKKTGTESCAWLNGNDGSAVADYSAVKEKLAFLISESKAYLDHALDTEMN